MGQQRLVGGDHVLAVLQRGADQIAGDAFGAADQFDHHIHIGIGGDARHPRTSARRPGRRPGHGRACGR